MLAYLSIGIGTFGACAGFLSAALSTPNSVQGPRAPHLSGLAHNQNQNQIYSLERYTVIPTATYSFVPPGCRRGRLAAAFPRPRVSGRLAPASA
eukprot:COSAG06_NODE_11716_length_1473_cov_13.180495_2_plen_93_part_01